MILYASSSLFKNPKSWLRAINLVPSSKEGWLLLQVGDNPKTYASMTPDGTWQDPSTNDGPYEQCLELDFDLVFRPRNAGEDQVVPFLVVAD